MEYGLCRNMQFLFGSSKLNEPRSNSTLSRTSFVSIRKLLLKISLSILSYCPQNLLPCGREEKCIFFLTSPKREVGPHFNILIFLQILSFLVESFLAESVNETDPNNFPSYIWGNPHEEMPVSSLAHLHILCHSIKSSSSMEVTLDIMCKQWYYTLC